MIHLVAAVALPLARAAALMAVNYALKRLQKRVMPPPKPRRGGNDLRVPMPNTGFAPLKDKP